MVDQDIVFLNDDKTIAFIDGKNIYASSKLVGFDIDYKKLRSLLNQTGRLLRANYYVTIFENNDAYQPLRQLVDWLSYNGYSIRKRRHLRTRDGEDGGQSSTRTNFQLEMDMAIDMVLSADHAEHMVLFAGASELCRPISEVQRKGCKVTVISTTRDHSALVSDAVRRQADQFIDLADIKHMVAREADQSRAA